MFVFYTLSGNTLVDSIAPWKQWSWGALSSTEHLLWSHTDVQSCRQIPSLLCISVEQVENNCWRFRIFKDTSALVAGEQKRTRKTNLDWKGVTPFAQARDIDNGSILRVARMIFQLECEESVECYCTETVKRTWQALGHFWLVVTHAWLSRERKVTRESEIPKKSSWARHTGTQPFWRIFVSIPPKYSHKEIEQD